MGVMFDACFTSMLRIFRAEKTSAFQVDASDEESRRFLSAGVESWGHLLTGGTYLADQLIKVFVQF